MGVMSLKQKSSNLVRCDLCRNVTHYIYNVTLGGMRYRFCSGLHAELASKNFQKNESLGLKPSIQTESNEVDIGPDTSLGLAE